MKRQQEKAKETPTAVRHVVTSGNGEELPKRGPKGTKWLPNIHIPITFEGRTKIVGY